MANKKRSLTGYQKEENDELWLWDDIPELGMEVGYKIDRLLHYEQSSYQEISIADTRSFGRMLILDGTPQITSKDGFIYNEMISHIALATCPMPENVAMIGGGDCGPAREAMRYESVKRIDVVEIDQRVVDACKIWMTQDSKDNADGRVHLIYRDGYKWIQEQTNVYDILLIDRSDPYGPATSLYKPPFYQYVHDSLTKEGIAVFQAGSPYYSSHILKGTVKNLQRLFPIVLPYTCTVPTFPGGIWCFVLASKKWSPLQADLSRLQWTHSKYINPDLFRASFILPNYIKRLLNE
ncbi:polyamine aminopropyltransferase [Paenibacillus vulneris]|uniref:Polyamine aminopropyltransferase n=1 Tax=Paenibacillus vulneris TaxID=1133364 RepID=A0ABW3ULL9_9BACL|nr:polyamine aminopropyltransferase [Paenibacillus sp. 32352]